MKFGVMGGSGLYEMEGLEEVRVETIDTPFGKPSDSFVLGRLAGVEIVFLPRHGRGHHILPGEINYRANIWGMKSLGVTNLISVSAVGSLKKEIEPGHIVIPDQFIDRTKDRPSTFFGEGVVAHVQFGDPVCGGMSKALAEAAIQLGITHHLGGTYVCMEGPLFSTRAESQMYRSFGASIIGMTNLQEAKLAREAQLCFSTLALSTDYDCWHESEEEVSVEAVMKVMAKNIENSKAILKKLFTTYRVDLDCPDQHSLQHAIMTASDRIPQKTKDRLDLILGQYLKA